MKTNVLRIVLGVGMLCGCATQSDQRAAQAHRVEASPTAQGAPAPLPNPAPAPMQAQAAQPQPPTAAPQRMAGQPADQARPGPGPSDTPRDAELLMTSARIGDREALAFRVGFTADGTALCLTPDAERSLTTIALRADRILLRESFESGVAADFAPELRDERLRSARAFLVERGIRADRIEIVKPAGRPVLKPGSGRPGGRGPVVEIVVQLPEAGAPGSVRGR